MKIIFLDIDGVLNVGGTRIDSYGQSFQPEYVANLAKIIKETEAEIVISSTWRMSGLGVMRNMWRDRNLPGNVKGITPPLESRVRGEEIKKWIELHRNETNVEKYIILDDDDDMLVSQFPYFIQCSNLKDEDAIRLRINEKTCRKSYSDTKFKHRCIKEEKQCGLYITDLNL